MNIIIASLQVSKEGSKGHFHPAIELALEGLKRSHDVAIISLPSPLGNSDRGQLTKLGIRYIEPPVLPDGILKSKEELAKLATNIDLVHLAYQSFLLDPLLHQFKEIQGIFEFESPDVIIFDALTYAPALVARQMNIPDYGYCAGLKLLAKDNMLSFYAKIAEKLKPKVDDILSTIQSVGKFEHLELLSKNKNYVFFPEVYSNIFNKKEDIFLAGALPFSKRMDFDSTNFKIKEKNIAVLSFGSVLDPFDFPEITEKIFKATKKLELTLYLNSPKFLSKKDSLPQHVKCFIYLPLHELLPKAIAYFHHGGANSFAEALKFGTHQILIPLTTDQPIQAEVLNKLNCGYTVTPEKLTVDGIVHQISNCFKKYDFLSRVKEVKNNFNSTSGVEMVFTDIENEIYLKNIYREKREIKKVLFPRNINDIKNIIKTANERKQKLYPLSTGKNYGLGSRLPVEKVDYIVDLEYINYIQDYNNNAGTIRIGSGVTQEQLSNYLCSIDAEHVLDVTGSSKDSSIVGNALERGVAHYGCRVSSILSMMVILGNGEIINCGAESVSFTKSSDSYPYGLGPDLRGLFFQSSFGIIVEATIALRSSCFKTFVFSMSKKSDVDTITLIDKLSSLKVKGIIPDNIHISNKNRKLSVISTIYQKYMDLSHKEALNLLEQENMSDLYITASFNVDIRLKSIIQSILTEELVQFGNISFTDENSFSEKDSQALKGIFNHSLGIPGNDTLYSLGFEERTLLNPDQLEKSNVGTFFLVPVLPFKGENVEEMINIVNENFSKSNFKAYITFNYIENHNLEAVINLLFDSSDESRRKEAKEVMLNTFRKLNKNGYLPQRMSIFQMPEFNHYNKNCLALNKKLKNLLDPNHVISPGRYGI